ncbi:MAG: hypothetical protein P4L84_28940 [Isosphaeraceae bacterium]|nr:hypothetical protein [Isosphaeraceae bacterium]
MAALAGVALGSGLSGSASASACPNVALRSGPSEHLPDCRAYEQVSPVEKGGADAVTVQPLFPAQASACGDGEACGIAYMNAATAFAGAPGNELPNAYLATRATAGWQTTALTPPTLQPPANGPAKVSYAFSADLSQTVLRVPLQPLTEHAPAGMYNLFLRNANGEYSLVTASPPSKPPEAGCGGCFAFQDVPAFAGASSDFTHVIFEANDSLLGGAPEGVENLYETVAEHVGLVGILPDGKIPAEGATAGAGIDAAEEQPGEIAHAISQDGSHVLFEATADGGAPDEEQLGDTELYDRIDASSTVEVSAPAQGAEPSKCETKGGICAAEPAQFWGASTGGSVVFFTSKAALTKGSYTGTEGGAENPGNDLYRFNVGTRTLTDLTADAVHEKEDPNGASVLGVLGTSDDGSYVYFVAEGNLAAGASSGKPNLYVWHGTAESAGTTKFIATLAVPDKQEEEGVEFDFAGPGSSYHSDILDWSEHPAQAQAYVTPDGTHVAFMSAERLTGYENEDQATGEADHEVFEYSAETGGLVCASCDPGGERPLGSAFIGAKLTERVSTPFHQPRALSDDGSRLFFSSPDPLVPGVSGGNANVFEYEEGSVALISGTGGGGDVFLDASASGDDVFFATREQLASSDKDELVDVYDARVDGGLPMPAAATPGCQDGACQGRASPAPAFPTPTSLTFTGSGNLARSAPPVKPTHRQLLARALARCRKLKDRKRRSACIDTAERRYASKAKKSSRIVVQKRRRAAR